MDVFTKNLWKEISDGLWTIKLSSTNYSVRKLLSKVPSFVAESNWGEKQLGNFNSLHAAQQFILDYAVNLRMNS